MKHILALAAGLTLGLTLSSAQAADPVTVASLKANSNDVDR